MTGHSAENDAGPCADFDEHACPVYCDPDCLSRVIPPALTEGGIELIDASLSACCDGCRRLGYCYNDPEDER